MLFVATMATISTGLMSPNSYGLNNATDQVGVQLASTVVSSEFSDHRHHHHHHHRIHGYSTTPYTNNHHLKVEETDDNMAAETNNTSDDSEDGVDDNQQQPNSDETTTSYHHHIAAAAAMDTIKQEQSVELSTIDHHRQANSLALGDDQPKRNKRKNFEPRYATNNTFVDGEKMAHFDNNNVCSKESAAMAKSRRKSGVVARKRLIDTQPPAAFFPMDLSGKPEEAIDNDDDSTNDSDDDMDRFHDRLSSSSSDEYNSFSNNCTDDDQVTKSTANNIPTSFSIHNLSKSHHQQQQQQQYMLAAAAAAAAASFPSLGGAGTGGGIDMREYAMNTMRELLGIYGLTAEVAESISKQLPMPAFNSGKFLENLSFAPSPLPLPHTLSAHPHLTLTQHTAPTKPINNSNPPSQPPTPPSTPLSPTSKSTSNHHHHHGGGGIIPPHITISQATGVTSSGNKTGGKRLPLTGGGGGGGNSMTVSAMAAALGLSGLEGMLIGGERRGSGESSNGGGESSQTRGGNGNGRGIFPNLLHSGGIKLEDSDSPPLDTNPLNALFVQSLLPTSMSSHHFSHHHHHHHSNSSAHNQQHPNSSHGHKSTSSSTTSTSQQQLDYTKYVRKFGSSLECGSTYCKDLNYREHFHCLDCNSRVFIKKEEMIRHFKWHKKRDESLQHGFMRYSPLDDCGDRYAGCTHNRKQTHYHCIKEGCDKVYISTSDVQMHANYHRKDSAIIQEGFQRYRATEECGAPYCAFFGQRTTHFHCRRSGCKYTFKNKSDMEKHKSYHIKDEQLARDGFKKFMKNEACPYDSCRFSRVCNHIHCIRPQCNYVLHSSGQLFSHKRKHDRQDSELAYRKYKLAQSMMKSYQGGDNSGGGSSGVPLGFAQQYEQHLSSLSSSDPSLYHPFLAQTTTSSNLSTSETLSERNSPVSYDGDDSASAMDLSTSDFPPISNSNNSTGQHHGINNSLNSFFLNHEEENMMDGGSVGMGGRGEEEWRRYCVQEVDCDVDGGCEMTGNEHYHCVVEYCKMMFTSKEGALEHARNHEQQEQITDNFYTTITSQNGNCDSSCIYQDKDKHYHCNWDNCREVILPTDKPFRRLEHYKMHEYSRKLSLTKDPLTMTHLATSIDGMFCRKRGRPPKNRVIEVWNEFTPSQMMDSPQAIFTSFKLPKPSSSTSAALATSSGSLDNEIPMDDDEDRSNSPNDIPLDFTPTTQQVQQPPTNTNNATSTQLNSTSFNTFPMGTPCSESARCPYAIGGMTHHHCAHARCLYATDSEDAAHAHSRDFHQHVRIPNGFEFHDREVDCGLEGCPSNKLNRHFHCTRDGCGYSFVQYSTMALHQQQHDHPNSLPNIDVIKTEDSYQAAVNVAHAPVQSMVVGGSTQDTKVSVVKASGTFFPLSSILQENSTSNNTQNTDTSGKPAHTAPETMPQTPTTSTGDITGSNTLYGPELSCSRPFCKLKRKYHYHCNACNQAFSEIDRLVVHVAKHSTGAIISQLTSEDNNNQQQQQIGQPLESSSPKIQVAPLSSLQNPPKSEPIETPAYVTPTFDAYSHFSTFPAAQLAAAQQFAALQGMPPFLQNQYAAHLMFGSQQHLMAGPLGPADVTGAVGAGPASVQSPLAAMANLNKRGLSGDDGQMNSIEAKKARIQNSMRILKDEPIPEGYLRFRFNEDCQYQHCGYREHQTHFHCQRNDCGYSFCDKTRFVQHTARHERLDTLMGGDFHQYRANVPCGRTDCAYTNNLGVTQNKASHFHCLKCEFVCTDTNKVVAHRRQHQKLDSIQAAGFEKFTPSQQCRAPTTCAHSGKQTHYHCLQCQYAVLGLAQMSAHKYRHMDSQN